MDEHQDMDDFSQDQENLAIPSAWPRWIVLVAILALIAIRATTVFVSDKVFDADPMMNPEPMAALAPAGSMTLDIFLLLSCAAGLVIEVRRGRGLDWLMIGLGLLPAVIVALQSTLSAGNMWIGASWVAAAFAGITLAHFAREPRLRVVIAAVLIGIAGPLLARATAQVAYEHRATVQAYEENREQFLAERGWAPDSASAQIFERRLRQPLPTTWYPTSNVLSTVLLSIMVACIGLVIVAVRRGEGSGMWGAMLIVIIGSGAMLWLGGSKGAMGIALLGIVLVIVPMLVEPIRRFLAQHGYVLAIAMPLFVILAISARWFLPEDFLNDRSLLFRAQYWVSSGEIVTTNPLLGVGPGGFQDAYVLRRLERNPEEVTSAHNVLIDWVCALGVTGLAWAALAGLFLIRAGRPVDSDPPRVREKSASPEPIDASPLYAAGSVATAMFVASLLIESHQLGGIDIFVRCIGAFAMFLIAWVVMRILGRGQPSWAWWALSAAAITMFMHAQMDVTMTQPATAAWCFGLLGVAATAWPGRAQGREALPGAWAVALILSLFAAGFAAFGAWPAWRQQLAMHNVVHILYPPYRTAPDQIRQRQDASRALVRAYGLWRLNVRPLHAAIDQLLYAARDAPGDIVRSETLSQAQILAEQAREEHEDTKSHAMLALVSLELARIEGSIHHRNVAMETTQRMTELDPNGLSAWVRYGDAAWLMDDRGTAAEAYQRALNINDSYELDPLKQLPEREARRIRDRLDAWLRRMQ